jgi:hypothetical protein
MSVAENGPPLAQAPMSAKVRSIWANFVLDTAPTSGLVEVAWYVNEARIARVRKQPSARFTSILARNQPPLDQGVYRAVLFIGGQRAGATSLRLGPDTGVVGAWLSRTRNGAPAWNTVQRPEEIWAHFTFSRLPRTRPPLTVTFAGPRAIVQRTSHPVRRRIDVRFVLPCTNCVLRPGDWRVVLEQGPKQLLAIHFRVTRG